VCVVIMGGVNSSGVQALTRSLRASCSSGTTHTPSTICVMLLGVLTCGVWMTRAAMV
jgi:hypothetical protein